MIKLKTEKHRVFAARWIYAPAKHPRLAGLVRPAPLRRALRALLWLISLAFPAACYLATEYIHFAAIGPDRLERFLQNRTSVAIGMLIVCYLLWVCLLLLFKKPSAANAVLLCFFGAAAVASHYKHALTGDFLYPWDLSQAGNIGELVGFLSGGIPMLVVAAALGALVLACLPSLTNETLALRWWVRVPIALALIILMTVTVRVPALGKDFLERHGMSSANAALQDSNYTDNGLVGAFTVNLLSMNVQKPAGYSKEAVEEILSPYQPIGASDDFASPDIIVILSESFWDPKLLPGSSFTDAEGNPADPIANFTEISSRPGAVSGMMANTALGGGTVRPEFEVLTGLSTDYLPSGSVPYQYLHRPTESFASLYKSMGYNTYAVHPYLPAFYSRVSGYPQIGLDNLSFEEEIYAYSASSDWQWDLRGKHISDHSFVEYIEHTLDENQGSAFVLGISMEAHQPYETKFKEEDLKVFAENGALDESTLLSFRNFTMAMYDADQALGQLVDYIDNREKETVLVYFGDHLPTLGTNYAAYVQSGMIADAERTGEQDRYVTQRTPFLIYANFPLKDSELLTPGTGNEIASYNLLNAANQMIGAPRTRYMQWLADFGKQYQSYNVRMKLKMTDALQQFVDAHRMITYDRIAGKQYSAEQ